MTSLASLTVDYLTDGAGGNREFSHKVALPSTISGTATNQRNHSIGQLRGVVLLAPGVRLRMGVRSVPRTGRGTNGSMPYSPFPAHILVIVLPGAQKEMIGTNTGRIVAGMQDAEVGGEVSERRRIDDAMREQHIVAHSEVPVAILVFARLPGPAGITGHQNLRPEPPTIGQSKVHRYLHSQSVYPTRGLV